MGDRQRLYDALNQNMVKIQAVVAESPTAAVYLVREHDRARGWLERHARAERELRL